MDPRDEDIEYLRDEIIIQEEHRLRMEAEWQEAEYQKQLPAKIIVEIKIPKDESTRNI